MVKAIPEGLHTVTAQLTIEGAASAIAFYQRAFGAEEVSRAPDPSGAKIWHAELRLGDSVVFVNDVFEGMNSPRGGQLWLYSHDVEAAWKRAVDAGANVQMPLADTFWGDRMGVVADAWGVWWVLAQRVRDLTPAEMKAEQDAFVASMKRS